MSNITVFADDSVITVINDTTSISIVSTESQLLEVGTVGPQGPQGPQGPPGSSSGFVNGSAHVEFEWNSVTTLPISVVTGDKVVIKASIIIMQAFNGTAPSLRIGDTGNLSRLVGVSDNNPSAVGEYSVSPQVSYNVDTQINLIINPGSGASQGSGLVVIEVQS